MTTQTTLNLKQEIRELDDQFESLFAHGDTSGMSTLYTDHGMVLPPGGDFVRGKEKIGQFWQAVMNLGIKKAKLEILEIEQQGDTAVETGTYTLSGEDGQLLDQGKYIVIWKQQNGQWKLHRDIFNTSLPPQPS
ncbi:hypothetical protein BH23BAC1_BH23BAC1_24320 [soil metagenome]